MIILHRVQELQNQLNIARNTNKSVGFVPTMGALHQGHLELVKRSLRENDITVCSIFVNPTQFNDPGDLKKYPRTLENDSILLRETGCHFLFAPEVKEMYSEEELERKKQNIEDKAWKEGRQIEFGMLDKVMEGAHRPGHFNGVVQVVSKLFRIVKPDRAYFGQKDFQQLAIIRSMTKQLGLPVQIIACPIVREADGLAMSSRNVRLTQKERMTAPLIYKTLSKINDLHKKYPVKDLKVLAEKEIALEPTMKLEYFEISDSNTLEPLKESDHPKNAVACIALRLGDVRLIDNILLE